MLFLLLITSFANAIDLDAVWQKNIQLEDMKFLPPKSHLEYDQSVPIREPYSSLQFPPDIHSLILRNQEVDWNKLSALLQNPGLHPVHYLDIVDRYPQELFPDDPVLDTPIVLPQLMSLTVTSDIMLILLTLISNRMLTIPVVEEIHVTGFFNTYVIDAEKRELVRRIAHMFGEDAFDVLTVDGLHFFRMTPSNGYSPPTADRKMMLPILINPDEHKSELKSCAALRFALQSKKGEHLPEQVENQVLYHAMYEQACRIIKIKGKQNRNQWLLNSCFHFRLSSGSFRYILRPEVKYVRLMTSLCDLQFHPNTGEILLERQAQLVSSYQYMRFPISLEKLRLVSMDLKWQDFFFLLSRTCEVGPDYNLPNLKLLEITGDNPRLYGQINNDEVSSVASSTSLVSNIEELSIIWPALERLVVETNFRQLFPKLKSINLI